MLPGPIPPSPSRCAQSASHATCAAIRPHTTSSAKTPQLQPAERTSLSCGPASGSSTSQHPHTAQHLAPAHTPTEHTRRNHPPKMHPLPPPLPPPPRPASFPPRLLRLPLVPSGAARRRRVWLRPQPHPDVAGVVHREDGVLREQQVRHGLQVDPGSNANPGGGRQAGGRGRWGRWIGGGAGKGERHVRVGHRLRVAACAWCAYMALWICPSSAWHWRLTTVAVANPPPPVRTTPHLLSTSLHFSVQILATPTPPAHTHLCSMMGWMTNMSARGREGQMPLLLPREAFRSCAEPPPGGPPAASAPTLPLRLHR